MDLKLMTPIVVVSSRPSKKSSEKISEVVSNVIE